LKAAQEILVQQSVFLAFCEDRLPDGNYHELLAPPIYPNPISRIVVFFRTPNDYGMRATAAIQRGAYATLGPFSHDVEVEGVLIRAIRDNPRSTPERLIEPLLRPVVVPNAFAKQSLKML
jgi:hypothetical protein